MVRPAFDNYRRKKADTVISVLYIRSLGYDSYQSRCVDRKIVAIARLSFHKLLCDSLIMPFLGPILASGLYNRLIDKYLT